MEADRPLSRYRLSPGEGAGPGVADRAEADQARIARVIAAQLVKRAKALYAASPVAVSVIVH